MIDLERFLVALGDLATVLWPVIGLAALAGLVGLVWGAAWCLFSAAAAEEEMMDEWERRAGDARFEEDFEKKGGLGE
jgi:hypothetical protein